MIAARLMLPYDASIHQPQQRRPSSANGQSVCPYLSNQTFKQATGPDAYSTLARASCAWSLPCPQQAMHTDGPLPSTPGALFLLLTCLGKISSSSLCSASSTCLSCFSACTWLVTSVWITMNTSSPVTGSWNLFAWSSTNEGHNTGEFQVLCNPPICLQWGMR